MPRKKNSPGPILEPLEPEPAPPEPTPPDLAPPEPGTYQYQSQDKHGYEPQDDGYGESSSSLEDFSSMSAECPEPPSSSVKPYRFTVTDTRQHREELEYPDKDAEDIREFHHYHHIEPRYRKDSYSEDDADYYDPDADDPRYTYRDSPAGGHYVNDYDEPGEYGRSYRDEAEYYESVPYRGADDGEDENAASGGYHYYETDDENTGGPGDDTGYYNSSPDYYSEDESPCPHCGRGGGEEDSDHEDADSRDEDSNRYYEDYTRYCEEEDQRREEAGRQEDEDREDSSLSYYEEDQDRSEGNNSSYYEDRYETDGDSCCENYEDDEDQDNWDEY